MSMPVTSCCVHLHFSRVLLVEIKKRGEGGLEEKLSVTGGFSPNARRTHSIAESLGSLRRAPADHTRYFLHF